jgi:hypothetical protein
MDFERFKEWAIEDISSRLPEDYNDAELYYQEVKKYGGCYTGLFLRKPGSIVSPTVNMEQFYGFYLNGAAKEELGSVMANMLQYHVMENDLDMDWVSEYEKAREHLFVCLSNAEANPAFLEGVPYMKNADLALTCHILSEIPGEGYVGTVVNDSLLEEYGIDRDELFSESLKNSALIMPEKVEFAKDLLGDIDGREREDPFYKMLIITNEKHYRGSAVLFYPGVMEKAAMMLEGSYYIIPSSVHEVLAIPADPVLDVSDLRELVVEANLMHVPKEEKLSDNVYYYDVSTGEFMLTEPEGERIH